MAHLHAPNCMLELDDIISVEVRHSARLSTVQIHYKDGTHIQPMELPEAEALDLVVKIEDATNGYLVKVNEEILVDGGLIRSAQIAADTPTLIVSFRGVGDIHYRVRSKEEGQSIVKAIYTYVKNEQDARYTPTIIG